jgi:hypothetical protein
MPHYVLQLNDDEGEDRFAIYSTIVDNLISPSMVAQAMLATLTIDERYSSWLKPYDAEELIRQGEERGYGYSERMKKLLREEQTRYFYWHPLGFCFAKLSDAYFCLPRELWRD